MSVINVGQSIVLGVVEGLTEFLPVSSTGHLKIVEGLMDVPVDDKGVVGFTAVIQVGAIAAVLVYFFSDIVRIVGAWFKGLANKEERYHHDYKFAWWVIFTTIPVVIVGVAAKPLIEGPLASLWVVAGSLIGGSVVMWLADRYGRNKRGEDDTGFWDAMLVGSSQILALLFPGFSRSGATIAMGLTLGQKREAATRFAFLLAIPAVVAAGLFQLSDVANGESPYSNAQTALATLISFAVGYAAIAWLLRYVATHTYTPFVIYRVLLGATVLILIASGVLDAHTSITLE